MMTEESINGYHDVEIEEDVIPLLSPDIEPIIAKAIRGELSRDEFASYMGKSPTKPPFSEASIDQVLTFAQNSIDRSASDRRLFNLKCSWAIYTKEWIEDIAEIVKGKFVLEVGAGRGILGPIMRGRGIDWHCTDAKPPIGLSNAEHMEAINAVKFYDPDLVFASWIPFHGTRFDYDIACMKIPMILVGEGRGGCNGSGEFWDDVYGDDDDNAQVIHALPRPYKVIPIIERYPKFRDVPQWDNIHDETWLVEPET